MSAPCGALASHLTLHSHFHSVWPRSKGKAFAFSNGSGPNPAYANGLRNRLLLQRQEFSQLKGYFESEGGQLAREGSEYRAHARISLPNPAATNAELSRY